jgi:hypothetical protein
MSAQSHHGHDEKHTTRKSSIPAMA